MKLIAKRLLENENSTIIFEYLVNEKGDDLKYYLTGYPSSTDSISSTSFENIYKFSQPDVDWWSLNKPDQYFEIFFLSNYALRITNYSFVTYGGSYGIESYPCGLIDWSIEYIYNNVTKAMQLYHSDDTHFYAKKILFSTNLSTNIMINRFKLKMIGHSSRAADDYFLSFRRFEVYGYLYQITPTCTQKHFAFTSVFPKVFIYIFFFHSSLY